MSSYAYQWLRNGVDIPGATGLTYVPQEGDLGSQVGFKVTKTNSAGSTVAFAAAVGPVVDGAPPPAAPLRIEGANFIDVATGDPIELRGFAYGHDFLITPEDAAEDAARGANCVRLVMPRWWGLYTAGAVDAQQIGAPGHIEPTYLARLVANVASIREAGLHVILTADSDCGANGAQSEEETSYCEGNNFWTPGGAQQRAYFVEMWVYLAQLLRGQISLHEWLSEPDPAGVLQEDVTALYAEVRAAVLAVVPEALGLVGAKPAYTTAALPNAIVPEWAADTAWTFNFLDNVTSSPSGLAWAVGIVAQVREAGYATLCNQLGSRHETDPTAVNLASGARQLTQIGSSFTIWDKVDRDELNYGAYWMDGETRVVQAARLAVCEAAFRGELSPTAGRFDSYYAEEFALLDDQTFRARPEVARPAKMTGLADAYVDENFGTRIYRVNDLADTPNPGDTLLRHVYPRQACMPYDDADQDVARASNGYWYLWDLLTGDFIPGGIDEPGGDRHQALVNFIDRCEAMASPVPGDGHVYWHMDYFGGFVWYAYNADTQVETELCDLTSLVHGLGGAWASATRCFMKEEGRWSTAPGVQGRYVALIVFTGMDNNADCIGFVTYDRQENVLTGSLATTNAPDHLSISPSGDYVAVSWTNYSGQTTDQCAAAAIDDADGVRVYTRDFATFTQVNSTGEHSDWALDPSGEDAFVSITFRGGEFGSDPHLTDGLCYLYRPSDDTFVELDQAGSAYDGIDDACHFSGLAVNKPGWVLVGWYSADTLTDDTPVAWKDGMLLAVEMKAAGRCLLLCHHQSVRGGNYIGEPHGCVNKDFTQVVFASNWRAYSDPPTSVTPVLDYMLGLPSWAIPDAVP